MRAVTLTAVAERAGVHHSALRRYFESHKDVLLQLAAESWNQWADAVCAELRGREVSTAELAETLTATLVADPLLCDLFANVPLHLEPDVDVAGVLAFKRSSRAAIDRMREGITASVAGMDEAAAFDVITATNAMAATLWQATHPAAPLAAVLQREPDLSYLNPTSFKPTLTRLLTATFAGLSSL